MVDAPLPARVNPADGVDPAALAGDLHVSAPARAYLCLDPFIADMVGATALSTAFETGVIDHVAQYPGETIAHLQTVLPLDARGLALLLSMLRENQIIEPSMDALTLTSAFTAAMKFRDLLESKLYFAKLAVPDFLHLLTALLMAPDKFIEHARIFKLFSYQHALASTPDNLERTARWMRLTTVLTTYEAAACLDVHDFSGYRRLLDVGGNSGEFALHLCRAHPALQATVYDMPVVCDIGAAHVSGQPEAARIRYVRRDPLQPALPSGHDLVCFKSMLHDWPDAEMGDFLQRAFNALAPGGTLMIFERGELVIDGAQVGYGQLPLMLFFRSYRRPETYEARLRALGFSAIQTRRVMLDMSFILITAVK